MKADGSNNSDNPAQRRLWALRAFACAKHLVLSHQLRTLGLCRVPLCFHSCGGGPQIIELLQQHGPLMLERLFVHVTDVGYFEVDLRTLGGRATLNESSFPGFRALRATLDTLVQSLIPSGIGCQLCFATSAGDAATLRKICRRLHKLMINKCLYELHTDMARPEGDLHRLSCSAEPTALKLQREAAVVVIAHPH
eukprot:CAMPEP_0115391110 /NCGR_PEP_ID=MMETSP0271-20121206/10545_1 /TAXON_ID=71861 /ORGANISM="Scrippsiella trochoidea, Strain CCMP3099" /LENGTH=194 /DNA_ID=CAMNT_0002814667 /DNA_START=113 /DNA_END=698 /DNA_ORIENTATION=+